MQQAHELHKKNLIQSLTQTIHPTSQLSAHDIIIVLLGLDHTTALRINRRALFNFDRIITARESHLNLLMEVERDQALVSEHYVLLGPHAVIAISHLLRCIQDATVILLYQRSDVYLQTLTGDTKECYLHECGEKYPCVT
jgi:hypothetical protein